MPFSLSPSSSSSSSCSALPLRLCLFAILIFTHQIRPNSAALIVGLRHHHRNHHHTLSPEIQTNQTRCNIFIGNWIHDDSYPIYRSSECPFIEPEFNCQLYGRPDSDYLKYRWKPASCELPRFNGVEFVERMRGRTVMFVGDSLVRNQWESLVCLVSSALPKSTPTQFIKHDPLTTFRLPEYGVTISFYKAPYLVDIDLVQGKRVLKLDDISGNGNAWRGVDVLVFNTGHWWSHTDSQQGWDYMQSGGKLYQDMDRLSAMNHAMKTWARWIDENIDTSRTRVFFQSISPSHYNPSDWGSRAATMGKNCYGQTAPANGMDYPADGYSQADSDQTRVQKTVLSEMNNPPYLLDITMLSALRKDAHPSIYSGLRSLGQSANPDRSCDCSHWCLPGLPDTWNQLFYTVLFF